MDQDLALQILKAGHNVLLTGSAGTGKTYVLHQFINHLKTHQVKFAVTASTGLAATHLNGVTIHSWSRIGIRDTVPRNFLSKLPEKERQRIQATEVLIIDEISMLHDYRLDMVEEVCRKVRKNDKPFGGIQVVLCGDFFQLPPVNGRDDRRQGSFAVNANCWQNGGFLVCYLEKSYRHSDEQFSTILNAIRAGDVRRSHAEALLNRVSADLPEGITPTQLYTTNADTDTINLRELAKLDGESHYYEMDTKGYARDVETLKKSCLAGEVIELKKGARVMFIRNNPTKGYINGTLGVVMDFMNDEEETPIVATSSGKTIAVASETWELKDDDDLPTRASISQLPLRLAWAITVHKSQGMTLDAAQIDLSKAFVDGMGYVALSRVRRLDDLTLQGINRTALRVAEEARRIDELLKNRCVETVQAKDYLIQDIHRPYQLRKPLGNRVTVIDKILSGFTADKPITHSLDAIRSRYPKAYLPWDKAEDEKLIKLHEQGKKTKELAAELQRQPGAIRSRLKKLLHNV